jgi:UDP-glucuronate 4-epimerase
MQPGDVSETFADISKSEKMLGYKPTTSVEMGVEKFINWYKDYSV